MSDKVLEILSNPKRYECFADGISEFHNGELVLYEDYKFLFDRHNALVEAVHKAMGRTAECDKIQTDDQLIADIAYLKRLLADARAEVDRLLSEEPNDGHS